VFIDVGAGEDFVHSIPKIVTVEGREVGVVRWHDELLALRNICPHQRGPVCRGYVMPLIVAESDGAIAADDDTPVLVCPWHGWEFEARTGRAAFGGGRYRLRTYPVKEEAGRVLVDVRAAAPVRDAAKVDS
jgi:nitrite reductase/ring-hydroxylating ferredoxin subunit